MIKRLLRSADFIVDIGPNAGKFGGEVVFAGTLEKMKKAKTLTALICNGSKKS